MIGSTTAKIVSVFRLFYKGFGFYKNQISWLIILGLFSGLLEGIGINAIIPFFSFLTGSGSHGNDAISKLIERAFGFLGLSFSLRYLLVFIFFVFLFRAVSLLINNYIKIKITTDYSEKVRNRLFAKVVEADWPHLLNQKLGHLNALLMTNVQYGESLLHSLAGIIMLLTGFVMYLFVAVNISWQITILTLGLSVILFFLFRPILDRTRGFSSKVEYLNRDIAHFVNEHVVGMKTLKATLSDKPVIDIAREHFRRLKEFRFKVFFLGILPDSLLQPIGLIFVLALFAFSYKTTSFSIAAFAAVVYLIDKMFIYLQQLQKQLQAIMEYTPYLSVLLRYEEEALLSKEGFGEGKKFSFNDTLEFKNVTFTYDGEKEVLKNFNFKLLRGEAVGLVGPSGAGKTTVADLVLRLFRATSGEIRVDGISIDDFDLRDWRSHIGYISQDMFLLNDTIESNIRFYDKNISSSAIEKAAKLAEIYEFAESLPEKFNTVVGERGTMLSMGQRQRIIIARALARDPKLLILDEATSSLDNETEREIQNVIERLKGRVTILIIAHRLSTVMNATRLVVLGEGKIVEEGVPADLLKDKNSHFYKIYNLLS